MAMSGSFDVSSTRTIIIASALRKLGVLGEGQSATTNMLTTGAEALNFMIKTFQGDGMPVFYLDEGYLYPTEDKDVFLLGNPSGADNFTDELGITKLTAVAASATTTITVSITAAADVQGTSANSDNIGVEMDDGSIHWTTISSGGGTTSLTIANATDDTAAIGNRVYFYTTKHYRPTEIEGAWLVDAVSQSQVPMEIMGLYDMVGQANRTIEGDPNQFSYHAFMNASPPTMGRLNIWPRFQNGKSYIRLLFQNPFDDMDAAGDNPSFPQEWYEALVYGLAVRLAPEYKLPLQERMLLKQEFDATREKAFMSSRENASIHFHPASDWSGHA